MTERDEAASTPPRSAGRVRRRRLRRGELTLSGDVGDPFFKTFFSRIPKDVAASFTAAQLDAVKLAFGARALGSHAIDLRLSIPLGRRSAYVVLLSGLERRTFDRGSLRRLLRRLLTYGNAVAFTLFLLMFAAALFVVVYVGKRVVGLDVFRGTDMLPDRTIERLLR